ncbi:hypothetical protein EST38_g1028 [Candolleomyces aberdarensis]|uniref:Uncharacterized protein n=1 Tax=Candolleomyces aberdarensis TaxID=2316362 RepID=A0A4Q2DY94_9AGAR|nr:hypothetical protein EST38_g1028 [Candolleomyces aberdarensis]
MSDSDAFLSQVLPQLEALRVSEQAVPGGQQGNAAEFAISSDLFRFPDRQLQQAKSEVGISPEKDINALTLNEKNSPMVPKGATPMPYPQTPQQGPQGQPQQQQGGNQQTPGPAGLPGMPGMNSSSNQNPNIMGGGGGVGMMGSDSMLFNTAMDFSTVVGEFEFGDVGSNIDFERDFAQWFNGTNDDLSSSLELK